MTEPITIAIDCTTPEPEARRDIVHAVARQSRVHSDRYFVLLGDEAKTSGALDHAAYHAEKISVIHAEPQETLRAACELLAAGDADALITSRATEVISVAVDTIGLSPHAKRAVLAACIPTSRSGENRLSLMLDVGANPSVSAHDLFDFAKIGVAYVEAGLGWQKPRVGLLAGASSDEANQLLQADDQIDFVGFMEGHDIPFGHARVIVCDGTTGKLVVEVLEGAIDAMFAIARTAYDERLRWKFGLRLLAGGLERVRDVAHFTSSGHILLGLQKTIVIAGADADESEFDATIELAFDNVKKQIPSVLDDALRP